MLRSHARTDIGLRRTQNEDALLALSDQGVFVVADGVGGRRAGELAAALTVSTFQGAATALQDQVRAYADNPSAESRAATLALLEETSNTASKRVFEVAQSTGRPGMTSTFVAAICGGGSVFIAHVGDSRAYLWREDALRLLTEDHTVINDLTPEQRAQLSPERLRKYGSVITRAIGQYPTVKVDTAHLDLLAGDRLFLCSDGLTDMLDHEAICRRLREPNIRDVVNLLVSGALEAGGVDNITVVGVDPHGSTDAQGVHARTHVMAELSLFEGLTDQQRLRISRVFSDRFVEPGEVLFREGEHGDCLFVVVSGQFAVTHGGNPVGDYGPGDHFGEMGLVKDVPHSVSITSSDFGHLLSIDREGLRAYCVREPTIGSLVMWHLLDALAGRFMKVLPLQVPSNE